MNPDSSVSHPEPRPTRKAGIVARFGQVAAVFAVQAALLFLGAGRLDWTWAWVFLAICVASVGVNGTILLRTSPATVAERGRNAGTRGWDKLVGGLWSLALFIGVPLVAGLDARSAWSGDVGVVWHGVGAVALAAGLAFAGWAMIANAYFSTAVRIQSDRDHTVCRTGPYRFVRHPGYVGFVLQSLATPVLLGSLWALAPGGMAAALMVLRTFLEDRMLRAELPGYGTFTEEVRYRLVPGIW